MRNQHELMFSRARVRAQYAVLPQEGIPASKLPDWPGVTAHVLTAPAMGAAFAEYRLVLNAGQEGRHVGDGRVEHFLFVLEGDVELSVEKDRQRLGAGGFALIPPRDSYSVAAKTPATLLLIRKIFEPLPGAREFTRLIGDASNVPSETFLGDPGAQLQLLIPDDPTYDLAMNIFTFEVGHSLPYVETHVMEHGLYFLRGKGLYFLGEEWMEVMETDFIWMGPYCPQCFYATGPVASQYIYYKNVNREMELGVVPRTG